MTVPTDWEKIEALKQIGIWQSLKVDTITAVEAHRTSYNVWTESGRKNCRLIIDFNPAVLLRSADLNVDFLCSVMDAIAKIQAELTPDLPDKIYLLEPPKEEDKDNV